jgi:hypothetical protein
MKKILTVFVLGFAIAGGLAFAANYTLIRSSDGWFAERKSEMTLSEAYVDTTQWGAVDFLKHPKIAAALAGRGFKKAFKDDSGSATKDAVEKGRKAIADGMEKAAEAIKP